MKKILKNLIQKSGYIIISFIAAIVLANVTVSLVNGPLKAFAFIGFMIAFGICEGIIILCLDLKYIGKGFFERGIR